jgi:hypothetical protein
MRWIALAGIATAITLASCATYQNAAIYGRWADVTREDIAAAVATVRNNPNIREPCVNLQIIAVVNRDEIELLWDQSGPHRAHDYIKRVRGKWQWVTETIDVG